MSRDKRFSELRKIPSLAAVDHRHFLNEQGEDSRLAKLPRKQRLIMQREGKKIATKYRLILESIKNGGVGYPVDRFIRELSVEYTHRYASSGIMNQPVSFNYFESFCSIKLIEGSVAPYAMPIEEYNHLFSVSDYFDYLTSGDAPIFSIQELKGLAEGRAHHFTQNGSINDFTYMTSEGREFVISGFSMVRHGDSLHWYVLGGEVLSEEEWLDRSGNDIEIDLAYVAPEKRPFLSKSINENGARAGAPVPLEGTKTAVRTVIAGETDLVTSKHVARCYMSESENTFFIVCDDPEVFSSIPDEIERNTLIDQMKSRVESAAVMWSLAEGLFQLPSYFQFNVAVSEEIVNSSKIPPPRIGKGGRGVGAQFKNVASIAVSEASSNAVRAYIPPHFAVETEGYWRRLSPGGYGTDREGNQIQGRTWVR